MQILETFRYPVLQSKQSLFDEPKQDLQLASHATQFKQVLKSMLQSEIFAGYVLYWLQMQLLPCKIN